MKEEKELGRKLQEIRAKLGKVVICQIGVRDDGKFDILSVKLAAPFEESNNGEQEMDMPISESKKRFYIN